MNISSVVVKTLDTKIEQCKMELSKIKGVEIALSQDSTIIATIEAEDTSEEVEIFAKIEKTDGVISVSMHYTYFEDELREEIANMNNSSSDILNDDSIPIENTPYSGSVYSMMKKNKKSNSEK